MSFCACTTHSRKHLVFHDIALMFLILLYVHYCGLCCVQANNMGGVTIPWGKASGDKAVDDSALKGAWEKAVKVAGWP